MSALPANELTLTDAIRSNFADLVGTETYEKHFQSTARLKYDGRTVTIEVPTQFHKKMLGRKFGDPIARAACAALGEPSVNIDFLVDPGAFADASRNAAAVDRAAASAASTPPAAPPVVQGASPRPLRHTLEDFVVGHSNELAYSAAMGLIDTDAPAGYRALVLHGASGLGKTHLLQGLAELHRQRHPGAVVRYVTGEQFVTDFVDSVRSGSVASFRTRYRGVDLLCLDDMQFLCGKKGSSAELLHTIDALDLEGGRVAIASDEHPTRLENLGGRLVSRFIGGMVVRVESPDESMRERIVQSLAHRRNILMTRGALSMIARLKVDTVRDIEGVLARAHAIQRLDGGVSQTLDESIIRQAIRGLRVGQPRRPCPASRILEVVCRELGVQPSEVLGNGRHRRVVVARGVSAYMMRQVTTLSFPEIARALGRRNHSTVATACRRIETDLIADAPLNCGPDFEAVTVPDLCDRIRREVGQGD